MNAITGNFNASNAYTSNKNEVGSSTATQIPSVEQVRRDEIKKAQLGASPTEQQAVKPTRFDVNEETIALIEEHSFAQQSINQPENQTVLSTSSEPLPFNNKNNGTAYDQPNEQNQTAISAYQTVGNIANKASIEQLFGIDLYA